MAEQTATTNPASTSEGTAPFAIPGVEESCSTFYKVYGDISSSNATPLVVVHGGPGAGHNYMLHFSRLWTEYKIPAIFYDQIGCGKSSLVKEKAGDASFWVEGLFIRELDNLVDHLGLRERGYDVFGHSWGGMVGPAYAATRPRGLGKLVAAHGGASKDLIDEATKVLAGYLPSPHRETYLEEFLVENPQESEAFKKAEEQFFCLLSRVDSVEELPEELGELIKISTESTSNEVM